MSGSAHVVDGGAASGSPEGGTACHTPIDPLRQLAETARAAGADALGDEATAAAERLQAGRFFVACIGQFKRGKSTLINALVGHPALPTGVIPVTSALTIVRHGQHPNATVHFADRRASQIPLAELPAYVTESGNPRNRKRVAVVEVSVPAAVLAGGLCLVDTPGLGSVFSDNSDVTRAFVPHIDAALIVLGADPPLSGDELDLIADVAAQIRNLIFVLNKADRVSEADAREASEFAASVIGQRIGRPVGAILQVSAAERAEGRVTRDWAALDQAVAGLAARSGEVVDAAARRAATRLAARLVHDIDEQTTALTRPIEDSERQLQALGAVVAEAERTLRDLGALFTVEQVALADTLREARRRFLQGAVPAAASELDRDVLAASERRASALRRWAMAQARHVARQHVLGWLAVAEPQGEELYRKAMERFRTLTRQYLTRLMELRGLPDTVVAGVDDTTGFTAKSDFFFTEQLPRAEPPFPLRLLDHIWPRKLALMSIRPRARAYLETLLETNSARVSNDLEERVRKSGLALESAVRREIESALERGRRALERARVQQAKGREAVESELARLATLRAQVEEISARVQADVEVAQAS